MVGLATMYIFQEQFTILHVSICIYFTIYFISQFFSEGNQLNLILTQEIKNLNDVDVLRNWTHDTRRNNSVLIYDANSSFVFVDMISISKDKRDELLKTTLALASVIKKDILWLRIFPRQQNAQHQNFQYDH
jgi:hypothetical protein